MITRIEITCVTRSDKPETHGRVLSVGGTNFAGRRWRMSQVGAIRGIEEGKYAFYMNRGGKIENVIVAIRPYGPKYLKTFADKELPNGLLDLPECPDQ
jgi:hypothetical protein